MKSNSCCRFCNLVNGKYEYAEVDPPFVSNKLFVATASIGALVEGWTLIIPKDHQFSMKYFYNDPEFTDFTRHVIKRLNIEYGRLIVFEHGANREGSITSCGTNHAHLHLVPFKDSLTQELLDSGLKWINSRVCDIFEKTEEAEYLFYTEIGIEETWNNPSGYLHILSEPISQYFRRLIAFKLGHTGTSDYKQFPYIETAQKTRKKLVIGI